MVVTTRRWNTSKVAFILYKTYKALLSLSKFVTILISVQNSFWKKLLGGPDRTYENIRDNLYSVIALAEMCRQLGLHFTYVGTGYLFAYDEQHQIGGQGFSDDGSPILTILC